MKRRPQSPEPCSRPPKIPKLQFQSEVAEDIDAFMSSEKAAAVSDITLVSSDGIRIPTLRGLLVIRCSYFEKMLTGDFAESGSNVVKLSIPATPLRHVLKYIYTGDCPLIRQFLDSFRCDLFGEVVDLACTADYLRMDNLSAWCDDTLVHSIQEAYHLHCCLVEELISKRSKGVNVSRVMEGLLDQIAVLLHPAATLGPMTRIGENEMEPCSCTHRKGVMHLSDLGITALFELVLKGPLAPEGFYSCLFQALLIWLSNDTLPLVNNQECDYDKATVLVKVDKAKFLDDRLKTAKYLAGKFDLSVMSPLVVNEVVQKSGLVEMSVINEAYRKLALQFEQREREAVEDRRKLALKMYKLEQTKKP